MSTFKITPTDVGRKAVARNGEVYTVRSNNSRVYPYRTDAYTLTGFGMGLESGEHTPFDLIRWADEQASDQSRPKDLRDEFAMVAMGAMLSASFSASLHNSAQTPDDSYLVKWSYDIADAMMKAREGKV